MKDDFRLWLAGLFDGEGWFRAKRGKYPLLGISMTDKDLVERAASYMGQLHRVKYRNKCRNANFVKAQYGFEIYGNEAIEWMLQLYEHLGERRRAKIDEILTAWETIRTDKQWYNRRKKAVQAFC